MGRLGSGAWLSASFQIFALTAGEGNVLCGEENLSGTGNVRGNMSEGECPGGNVLNSRV